MASVVLTPVLCPNCRRPFTAEVRQIYDAGRDPSARGQLLRWRPPALRCPHCGYNGPVPIALLYHDPAKDLLAVHVPVELGLRQSDQERLIGDLTNRVINSLPADQRRGYLLQPKLALSVQGLIDMVLQAEGVTPEMVDEQKRRVELIDRLARAPETELPTLVGEHDAQLDAAFFQMLSASIESALAEGQPGVAQQLAGLRERILPHTSVGRRIQRQSAAIEELQQTADRGELNVESLLERLATAEDEAVLEALVAAARPLLDYSFFMALAERIGQAEGRGAKDEAERLKTLRERVLALSAEIDRRNREVLDRATQTLRTILQARDVEQAVHENAATIDDAFMAVLEANLQAAEQAGQQQALQRLQQVSEAIMRLMQANAPPEIQFINEILSHEDPQELEAFLRAQRDRLTPELLGLMADIADNMRASERPELADRLDQLRGQIGNIVAFGD
jgi:hypothetical protein